MKLEVVNLVKSYGNYVVFNDWSYSFVPGCYTLIGPNGIGKSTLLAVMAGTEKFQNGQILLDGKEQRNHPIWFKERIGYCPDRLTFYPFLTVSEFLHLIASIKKCSAPNQDNLLIKGFNIEKYLDTPLNKLSLGTQKKVLLTGALINNPGIILLDEPTDELDNKSKRFLKEQLRLRNVSITVISTHDVSLIKELDMTTIDLNDTKI